MGYYLQIDEDEAVSLASLSGWGDVIKWADSLPVQKASAIQHFCQFGWEQQVTLLKIELEECLKSNPPKDSQTKATVQGFIDALVAHKDKATVVSVTDGLGPE